MSLNTIKKIGLTFPFDFLNLYGGAAQRLRADLNAFKQIGCDVELIFPTKCNKSLLTQHGYELNTTLKTYCNLEGVSFLPSKIKLLLDEYGQIFNPFFYLALRKYFKNIDILFVHFPFSFWASYMTVRGRRPILYVAHNFEYGLIKQATRNPIVHKYIYFLEKYACKKATKVLCVSEKDKFNMQQVYNLPDEKVAVFPNCVDIEFFSQTRVLFDKVQERQKLGINPSSFVLLFTGKMDYRPNLEALNFILEELVPAMEQSGQNISIHIVGAQIPKYCFNIDKQTISFHANVPDMRRYFAIADVAIVPLSSGSGTRIKILESFAAKLPVVSTAIGCEGIECFDGEHIILAQRNAEDFVNKVVMLIKNKKMRETVINNSYQLVKSKYSIESARLHFKELIKHISCNNNI